jgi:DnaJ-class molecular chaperone
MSLEELKPIRTFEDGSFAINCAFCEGSGVFPEHNSGEFETDPCIVCDGKGINVISSPLEDVIKCRYCGGLGRGWDRSGYNGDICQVCQGKGILLLDELRETRV